MQSKAKTVDEYLAELPADRRAALSELRRLIQANIDAGFREGVGYGMIGWSVPHSLYPPGYHCDPKQPLPYAGLASQKHHMSLYICPPGMGADDPDSQAESDWFRAAWAKTGKKLDMGKGCIRFKRIDDLALDVIAESFRRMSAARFVAMYEAARAAHKPRTRAEIQAMMAERAAAKTTKPAKQSKPTTAAKTTKTARTAKPTAAAKTTKAVKPAKAAKPAKTAKTAKNR